MASYSRQGNSDERSTNTQRGLETETNNFQTLTVDVQEAYDANRMTDESLAKKLELRNRLERTIKDNVGQRLELRLYGSIVNGFGRKDSDLDMTLNTDRMQSLSLTSAESRLQYLTSAPSSKYVHEKEVDSEVLTKVFRALKSQALNLREMGLITHTVMPIIKGADDVTGNTWQISTSNDVGVKNARLLKMYSKADPRLVPLATVIKLWAGSHGINDARNQMPNNYCWTILVVYYLMAECSPPVLPCLHKTAKDAVAEIDGGDDTEADIPSPGFESSNTQSLGELLAGFFAFYADNILRQQVFSIREGRMLSPWTLRSRRPTRQWECLLLVEDPTSLNNIPRSVINPGSDFPKVAMKTLRSASELCRSGASLSELMGTR